MEFDKTSLIFNENEQDRCELWPERPIGHIMVVIVDLQLLHTSTVQKAQALAAEMDPYAPNPETAHDVAQLALNAAYQAQLIGELTEVASQVLVSECVGSVPGPESV